MNGDRNRLNGFDRAGKTVKTVSKPEIGPNTQLKQGVNGKLESIEEGADSRRLLRRKESYL
jgi:hypothetical protein